MVNRSKISKEIRRRTGGVSQETGEGKTVKQINLWKDKWEQIPGTGTSNYNPPKFRLKKKEKLPEKKKTKKPVGVGKKDVEQSGAKRQLAKDIRSRDIDDFPSQPRNRAMIEELKRTEAEKAKARLRRVGETDIATRPVGQRLPSETLDDVVWDRKTGGKVSRYKGGKVGNKKKSKKTYGGHHGSKYVAKLYK